jgi:hypothetical protein
MKPSPKIHPYRSVSEGSSGGLNGTANHAPRCFQYLVDILHRDGGSEDATEDCGIGQGIEVAIGVSASDIGERRRSGLIEI